MDFKDFETQRFPEELCTEPSKEQGVMDSTATFLCVIADPRFPGRYDFELMSPYTAKMLEGPELSFGWVVATRRDDFGVDNHFRPIAEDARRVIAWKRVEGLDPNVFLHFGVEPW